MVSIDPEPVISNMVVSATIERWKLGVRVMPRIIRPRWHWHPTSRVAFFVPVRKGLFDNSWSGARPCLRAYGREHQSSRRRGTGSPNTRGLSDGATLRLGVTIRRRSPDKLPGAPEALSDGGMEVCTASGITEMANLMIRSMVRRARTGFPDTAQRTPSRCTPLVRPLPAMMTATR